MATNDATIIATRLTSDELEKSINELVSKVESGINRMAKVVDNGVARMSDAFAKLGDGLKSTGGTRRTEQNNKEAESVKKLSETYDTMAQSIQKAVNLKPLSSRVESYGGMGGDKGENIRLGMIQRALNNIEIQKNAISAEIAKLETKISEKTDGKIEQLNQKIEQARQHIKGFQAEIAGLEFASKTTGVDNSQSIQVARNNIQRLKQEIAEYQEQISKSPEFFSKKEIAQIDELRKKLQQLDQQAKELQNKSMSFTNTTPSSDVGKTTNEIQKQAQAIRESAEWQEKGRIEIQSSANAARTYIISAKSRLSIEERLLEIQKQETAELERQRTGGIRTTGSGSGEIGIKATREEIEQLIQAQRAADPVAAAMVERAYQVEASMDRGATAIGRNRQETRMTFGDYENLRAAIAAVLNVEQHRVQLVDQGIASYNKLNESLKQMTQAYQKLGSSDRSSDMGKNLASEIQKTQRAINEIQKQMTRPVSLKHALGLEEKTLDQISYKIQQLGSYMRGLDITNQRSSNEINQVTQAMNRLKQKQTEILGENARLTSSNNALARSFNYMKNRLAFYFTIGASTQFVKQLIDIRSQYEMNERALGILIGSAEHGTRIFKELSSMALVSPYTLIELSSAAKQLAAYGVAAKDVVETTRRLADMAAAVGIPMERLTYALGQIQAYGYLNARDARMFANAGIPLVRELANHYTKLEGKMVSVSDIYDRIKKKAISYNDVMQVVNRMTDEGGQFFDFQAKMADTLKVQLANLNLAWNNMLNDLGQSQQGLLVGTISALKQFFLQWKKIDALIWDLVLAFGAFKLGQFIYLLNAGVLARTEGWNILVGKKLTSSFKSLGATMKSVFTSAGTWITIAIMAVFDMIQTIKSANDAVKQFNKDLSDAGKERFDNITATLKQLNDVQKNLYTWGKDSSGKSIQTGVATINTTDAQKTWETLKELLEENSSQGEQLVGTLLKIEDVNERLRAGFNYVKEIQAVNGAIQELGESGLKVTQNYSAFWNLWAAPDGLIKNFEDYHKTLDKVTEAEKKFGAVPVNLKDMLTVDASRLVEDFQKLTESLQEFATSRGFNVTQEIELMQRAADKLIQDNNIDTKRAVSFRIDMEDVYVESRKKAFDDEIAYELSRQKQAQTQREKDEFAARRARVEAEKTAWLEQFNVGRTAWAEFTSWMKRNHSAEIMDMFGNMTKQEREHYIKTRPEFKKWAEDNAKAFSEQYGVAFDRLWKWCKDASNWTIFLNVEINANTKSLYDTLSELDKQADEAYKKLRRLRERQKQVIPQEERTLLNKEIIDNEKDYNDAIKKGGKSSAAAADAKKAETAARKGAAAATRAQRQAESELQKALKEELSLIDKVRSTYKTLTKEGVDSQTALTESTSGYEKTIQSINKTLGKFGITPLDLTKYAGVSNPREIMNMLQSQLDKLSKSGAVKPAEIKDLQVKLKDLKIDSITFDQKAITTSLNNELSKLKEEYELAVELDANPELGDMFADMFDIDTTEFPKSIDEYMWKVQDAFEKAVDDSDLDKKGRYFDVFTANAKDWSEWAERVGMSEEALKNFNSKFVEARDYAMKWARDTIKATQDLEYKLADTDGKIAIEKKKLANLEQQLAQETNEEQRHLLELQIQDQKNAVARLKDEAVATLDTYKNLFNSIVDHSARVTRKLAQQWKGALENALKTADNEYIIRDPISGKTSHVSEEKYNKLLDQVNRKLRETQNSFAKIKEALTKGEDKLIDWEKAMEFIADEAKKVSDGVKTIGNISEVLGASENTVEIINDIADSIDGLATTAQGIAQMSTDPIGGAFNVVKGLWQSISSWFDNSNKKIDKKVKESERNVARLEIAYKRLEHAVENSMGTAETQARRATIANKELQLTEKQRELDLEKSRKSKNQDQDKIIQLEGEIQDLEFEIENLAKGVADSLLGSEIKSAAEDFVDTWVSAWKEGEKTLDAMNEKVDEMIYNLIKKAATSAIVGKIIKPLYDAVDKYTSEASAGGAELTMSELEALSKLASTLGVKIDTALGAFYNNLEAQNIISKGAASSNLSALQQGIQGITEDTAGALESYMNIVSQQVFLHSDLLTQIRDAVVMMSGDVQLATQAQMLLQLQQSYSVQMAIQAILEGWTNANGMAVRVELTN